MNKAADSERTEGDSTGRDDREGTTSAAVSKEHHQGEEEDPRPCLSDLFHNYRQFDVGRLGHQALANEMHDDRLLPHFSVVNPLQF